MLTTDTDTPWLTKAACQGMDQGIFFPDDELPSSEIQKANRAAKLICAECPVREACLAEALCRQETDGVWGGKSPKERRRLLGAERPQQPAAEMAAQTAAMVREYEAGDSVSLVAARHGLSRGATWSRLSSRVDMRPSGMTPRSIDEAEVARRYLAGESLTALGRAYGVSVQVVTNRLERQGVPRRPKKGAPGWSAKPALG